MKTLTRTLQTFEVIGILVLAHASAFAGTQDSSPFVDCEGRLADGRDFQIHIRKMIPPPAVPDLMEVKGTLLVSTPIPEIPQSSVHQLDLKRPQIFPREEVVFNGPGFRLEVLTERTEWPSIEELLIPKDSNAPGHVTLTLAEGLKADGEVSCVRHWE